LIGEAVKEYKKKTSKSLKLFERASISLPGGVCHNVRLWGLPNVGAYPFYTERARGSHLWDVDGNEYVDYWCGHSALILGHTNEALVKALHDQVQRGIQWGTTNEKQVELAELVRDMVPSVDIVRFCSTGTEATMYAARMARAYTGKKTIIKQKGGWHGANDSLFYQCFAPYEEKESLGLLDEIYRYVKTIPFGDVSKASEEIQKNRDDLAAVILDCSGQGVLGTKEFLKAVRRETEKHGALMMLDEIVTGFRLAPGGAQEFYNVTPDLTVMGKVLGGGTPIGAVGGREEIMKFADPLTRKKPDIAWIGGGTFSGNPFTMTAGVETLKILKHESSIYDKINSMGSKIRNGLVKTFESRNFKASIRGECSLFFPLQILTADSPDRGLEYFIRLMNKGVFTAAGGGFVSAAHTDIDVKKLLEAAELVVEEMS